MNDNIIASDEEVEAEVESSRAEEDENVEATADETETVSAADKRANMTALELADMDAIYPKDIPLSREQIRNGGWILYIIGK